MTNAEKYTRDFALVSVDFQGNKGLFVVKGVLLDEYYKHSDMDISDWLFNEYEEETR